MQIELNGKRVFITGGGAGMGRATALAMAKLGAEVFTCDVDVGALADLPDSITSFVADVVESAQLDAIFAQILPGGSIYWSTMRVLPDPQNRLKTSVTKNGGSAWQSVSMPSFTACVGWYRSLNSRVMESLSTWSQPPAF